MTWKILVLILTGLATGVALVACSSVARALWGTRLRSANQAVAPEPGPDLYDFDLTAIDGSPYPLAAHRGQVTLLVNTASRCGFTSQYDGLEALWQRERARGLIVVGVPTNDFMNQEPGTDAEILEFCRLNHGVSFPLMARTTLRGPQAETIYRSIQHEGPLPGAVPWNFEKILIGRDGRIRARFAPRVRPDAPELMAAMEEALQQAAPG